MSSMTQRVLIVAIMTTLVLTLAHALVPSRPTAWPPVCAFAPLFPPAALVANRTLADQFVDAVVYWEAQFLQPSPCSYADTGAGTSDTVHVGLHTPTGMTLDGHRLAVATGTPLAGGAHLFTASSKECNHLAMIARALAGDNRAQLFLSPSDPTAGVAVALNSLATKINTYDVFNLRLPGFGGFLPWVNVNDSGIWPTDSFASSVPALDNGELIWAVTAITHVLRHHYPHVRHTSLNIPAGINILSVHPMLVSANTTLYERWQSLLDRWTANIMTVFYAGQGRFRSVTQIRNCTAPVTPANYYGDGYLNDPYEGELFTDYAYLFADWTSSGDDRELVWQYKRSMLQSTTLHTPRYNFTVQRGFWYSAHEQWKYLYLPYHDSSINRRVFVNGEKARIYHSISRGIAGLYAATNGLATSDSQDTGYVSDCGIAEIAFEPVTNVDIVTPYGAMALLLANLSVGQAWLTNHLSAMRGQTCFGAAEALNRTGASWSPMKTWDTSITSVVAMLGGLVEINRQFLIERGKYKELIRAIDREWTRVFDNGTRRLEGEDAPWQLPATRIAAKMSPLPSCTADSSVCQCQHRTHQGIVSSPSTSDIVIEAF